MSYVINKLVKILFYSIISVFAFMQLFPLIWMVDFSLLKDSDLFVSGILKWPAQPQWQNYISAWIQGHVAQYFLNSVIVNFTSIVVIGILSIMMGYAFTRMQWKLRYFTLTVILLGMMIPIHATLLPNFLIFKRIGLLNSYLGLILPYAAVSLPMGVFLMTGFMKSIPVSLEEAATIDGCGTYGIIFKIIVPLVKPAIVTVVIMSFFNSWNDFIMAFTYVSKNTYKTLPFSVYEFAGQYSSRYAVQFAVMTITALPALILYAFMNEQITKGVTVGALKG